MSSQRGVLRVLVRALGILSALLFVGCQSQEKPSPLHVHIFDTDFCREVGEELPDKVKVQLSGQKRLSRCRGEKSQKRRFHGSWVLKEMLSHVSGKEGVVFHLHRVFNDRGEQQESLWQKALAGVRKGKSHLVVAAAGFPVAGESPKMKLPGVPFVVASGNVSKGIRRETQLWPQAEAPAERLYLVGSKIPGPRGFLKDSTVLYRDQVNVFYPGESRDSPLAGSSLALATAAGQLIESCREGLLNKKTLKNCGILK